MSNAVVPMLRANPDYTRMRVGAPVSAGAWRDALFCNHAVLGWGRQVVPWYTPGTVITAGSNETFRFRVRGTYAAVMRRWSIWAIPPSNAGVPIITVTVPDGGTPLPVPVTAFRADQRPIHFTEYLAAVSENEVEATINIAVAGDDAKILGLACTEYPRFSLAITGAGSKSDDGGVPDTVAPRQMMADHVFESIGGVVSSQAYAFGSLRRHEYQWARPANTTDARAFAGAWADGIVLPAPVLGETPHVGDTTVTVNARVYAATTGGGGGEVRFNTASGGTAVATIAGIAGTTFAWYPSTAGAPASFSINAEDLGTADGLPAATWETVMWQGQRTSGTLYVAGVSIIRPGP